MLRCIPPLPGNNAHWQESSLPTLQRNPPTLGNIAPRPTPTPPMAQRIQPALSNHAPRPMPTLLMSQCVWPTLGNVAPWPTHPAGAACQPCRPKLALQLPVDAAPQQALHASSSPAHIANVQEQPCFAVVAKSGGQAGCGGGGSNAIGRWFGWLPSIGQEQCAYMSCRTAATMTRSCAQAHNISTSRRTTATTTRTQL
jgi:hypothetical protein